MRPEVIHVHMLTKFMTLCALVLEIWIIVQEFWSSHGQTDRQTDMASCISRSGNVFCPVCVSIGPMKGVYPTPDSGPFFHPTLTFKPRLMSSNTDTQYWWPDTWYTTSARHWQSHSQVDVGHYAQHSDPPSWALSVCLSVWDATNDVKSKRTGRTGIMWRRWSVQYKKD